MLMTNIDLIKPASDVVQNVISEMRGITSQVEFEKIKGTLDSVKSREYDKAMSAARASLDRALLRLSFDVEAAIKQAVFVVKD